MPTNITVTDSPHPVGTTVGAYPSAAWGKTTVGNPDSGSAPKGTATASGVVSAAKTVALTGLAYSTEYFVTDSTGAFYRRLTTGADTTITPGASSVGSTEITDLSIANADVSATAAITGGKLNLTSGTGAITASGLVDVPTVRASANTVMGSGSGTAMIWTGTIGAVYAYNWTANTYLPIKVDGSTAEIQASGTTRLKADGTGLGFYTATPVARAAAITAPTAPGAVYVQAEAAAMKTAVDAIRTALTNIGITL